MAPADAVLTPEGNRPAAEASAQAAIIQRAGTKVAM
jgi:hypothetical protein